MIDRSGAVIEEKRADSRPVVRRRLPTFSLRTLLLLFLVLGGGTALIQQHATIRGLEERLAAHGLAESGGLQPGEFRVIVRNLAGSGPPAVHEVVIETLGQPSLSVKSPGSSSSLSGGPLEPEQLVRSSVLVVADQIPDFSEPHYKYRFLVTLRGVGGPKTHFNKSGKTFAELFELLIEPGVYPRGKPLPLCRFDDDTTELLVK